MSELRRAFAEDLLKSLYLTAIGAVGLVLFVLALKTPVTVIDAPSNYVLYLLLLAAAALQFGNVLADRVAHEMGSVIALAAGALFGEWSCVLVSTISAVLMVVKQVWGTSVSKGSIFQRVAFNNGMFTIAGYLASLLFLRVVSYADNLVWFSFSWLITGFVFHWINTLILSVMLQIQGVRTFKESLQYNVKTDWWSIAINGVGAGLFATAVSMTGAIGVVIFTFPLVLMFVSMRIIIQDAEAQKAKLEQQVEERTEELREANVSLQNLLVQKNRFLSILSHDMKTPLTAIRLYGQMLKSAPSLKDRQRDKIATTILDSENNLTDLVSNVLDVEGMQADTEMVMDMERFDWAETVAGSLATLELQAERKHITLKYHGLKAGLEIVGDISKLRRVAINLLSNAVKYTPEQGRIEVTLKDEGKAVLLKVADSGYGIPAEQLDSIFEPYHRVEENNQYATGTGLGLSVVKMIVEGHGGQIMVESMVDEGSTFTVKLLREVDEGRISAETPPTDDAAAKQPQLDTQPSSPHPQQNESEAPAQTHTPEPASANQS